MKKLLFLVLFPCLVFSQENLGEKIDWLTNFEEALEVSKKENKNLLVYFTGSDWCAPCKKLKSDLFSTTEFQTLSKDYVLVYIDIPRNTELLSKGQLAHNKALLPKLNKKGVFPLMVIVDSKEKALDNISGYSMNGEISYHLNLLKKYRG